MSSAPSLRELLAEYDRALAHTHAMWHDLSPDDVRWRPHAEFSPIGWHLGHQAAVAHFMIRNLTAAEPSPDPELEPIMDSATSEVDRGALPDVDRLGAFRHAVAERVRARIEAIDRGEVDAPDQLRLVAASVMTVIVNHEYQHSTWIGEVRGELLGRAVPPPPTSPRLSIVDGYPILTG